MKRRQQPRARALTIDVQGGKVVLTGATAPAQSSLLAVMLPAEARRLARDLVDHARQAAGATGKGRA